MKHPPFRDARRRLLTGLLAGAAGAALPVLSTPALTVALSPGAAVNKAGRQRMLTQRIIKSYCQVGLGVTPAVSWQQLADAQALFEAQLAELVANAPAGRASAALARLEERWKPFKSVARGPVSQSGARQLAGQSDALLAAADELTRIMESISGAPAARLVNIAGRQRMLSQRLAKTYMLRLWELDNAALRDEAETARREFEDALAILLEAPENTPEITEELAGIALQWEWFRSALDLEGAATYRLIAAEASDSILAGMETITRRYEELAER